MKWYKLAGIVVIVSMMMIVVTKGEDAKSVMTDFYKEIELFADAISLLTINYVEPPKPKELVYGALRGMLASLDDYSQFMEPDNFKEMKEDTKGEFGGLGVEIGMRNGMLTVISPIDGTPAAKAGIMPQDVVVKIDGQITKEITMSEAVKQLRGKPGTKVILTIWREKEERFLDITVVRAIIEIKSIPRAVIVDDKIGYIKLTEFQDNTAKELKRALKKLEAKKLTAVIIDLRNNAGGLLNAAIDVSDVFLKKGMVIVSTKGRIEYQNKVFKADKDTPYSDIFLVVLVNEGSASASEIVAGAIRDNKRGILVGQKTFGKGSVQTVIPLKDGSAVRITTAEYFTPKGTSIRKKGIVPDVVVDLIQEKAPSDDEDKKDVFKKLDKPDERQDDMPVIDSQLKAAIDVIHAINVYKEKD